MEIQEQVRHAFAQQGVWCARLGSPFTALLMEVLGQALDRQSATGRRVLDWSGDPTAAGDSVPLRLAGALNALVRKGRLPDLAALYPPNDLPTPEVLASVAMTAIAEADAEIAAFLDFAPQTNEVARSGILYPGFIEIAARTGLPLRLFEVGASSGLNLIADRYAYRLGDVTRGKAGSPVRLAPAWEGAAPEGLEPQILSRRGCDLNPLDLADGAARERMLAYIWPDQPARLARIEAAIGLALQGLPQIDKADAAAWVEERITPDPEPGAVRVLFHSIAFQYFPADVQARIRSHMARMGEAATGEAPLAWLSFEVGGEVGGEVAGEGGPELSLTLWPGGERRILARADAHVRQVTWLG
ncbi:DUF2332 family protein [Rhodobacteraceae bacterium NNCM2]|nr:DUF2332 family protein [Coraliihabitans acroporae]